MSEGGSSSSQQRIGTERQGRRQCRGAAEGERNDNATSGTHNRLRRKILSVGDAYFKALNKPAASTHEAAAPLDSTTPPYEAGLITNEDVDTEADEDTRLGSVPETVVTFTNYMFGATTFAMPYALACGGWSGVIAMGCSWAVALGCGHMLHMSLNKQCKEAAAQGVNFEGTYSSVVRWSLGERCQTLLVFTQYTSLFLWAAGFVLGMGSNMAQLWPVMSSNNWIVVLSFAILPTAWVGGNYKFVAPLSYVGLSLLAACLLLVIGKCLDVVLYRSLAGVHRDVFRPEKFFLAYSLMTAAWSGHVMMPALRNSMREPERFGAVLNVSYLILLACFIVIGSIGYIAYGSDAKALITLSFEKGSILTYAVQAIFVVAMYTKVGLTLNPIAVGVERRIDKWTMARNARKESEGQPRLLADSSNDEPSGSQRDIGYGTSILRSAFIRTVLVFIAMVAAIALPDFGFVQSLVGASFALVTAVYLPVFCFLGAHRPVSVPVLWACLLLLATSTAAAAMALYQLVAGAV